MEHDPTAVIPGGKGGGFEENNPAQTLLERRAKTSFQDIKPAVASRPGPTRLKSIPVTLNKLKEDGRYILTADDEDLREILRIGLERERNPLEAKKRRSKFSDLVFTRQFTTFDRQNAASAESPFHGFFNLFWLGIAIYMLQIASHNWRQSGNLLGTNEIMSLMFHRDVMVLGISE